MLNNKNLDHRNRTEEEEEAVVKRHPIIASVVDSVVLVIGMILILICFGIIFLHMQSSGFINTVYGESMYPTLEHGQLTFTDTSSPIDRGDIVTAIMPQRIKDKFENHDNTKQIIKRVIGLPGDRIIIDETGVYVNGEKLDESYLTEESVNKTYNEVLLYNSVLLDENEYFLMGDNRGYSFDSRTFGVLKANEILYKKSETITVHVILSAFFYFTLGALFYFIYQLIEYAIVNWTFTKLIEKDKEQDYLIKKISNQMKEIDNVNIHRFQNKNHD